MAEAAVEKENDTEKATESELLLAHRDNTLQDPGVGPGNIGLIGNGSRPICTLLLLNRFLPVMVTPANVLLTLLPGERHKKAVDEVVKISNIDVVVVIWKSSN